MPKVLITNQHEYVFGLDDEEFNNLCIEVDNRKNVNRFGCNNFEDLAIKYGRKPICPICGNDRPYKDGKDKNDYQRFRCKCGYRFNLLTNSILSSTKANLSQWFLMIRLMSYNVPLDLIAEQIGVHHNTALLMRRKLFESTSRWQNKVKLMGNVYIDEIYTYYSNMPENHFGKNRRGLNRSKCCIFLAIDQYQHMIMFYVGNGIPTSSSIKKVLIPHLLKGAVIKIIHDGAHTHRPVIEASKIKSEVHDSNNENDLKAMLLINSFSSWVKRYLSRFTGMDSEYLQDYLNWFVYLFRCKQQDEIWDRDERILRHILLEQATIKRNDVKTRRHSNKSKIEKSINRPIIMHPLNTGRPRGRPRKNIKQ